MLFGVGAVNLLIWTLKMFASVFGMRLGKLMQLRNVAQSRMLNSILKSKKKSTCCLLLVQPVFTV